MGPFEKHVFVCTSGTVCPVEGAALAVHARLKEMIKDAGLKTSVRINHAGCMDQCGHGPMVVVYPENIWYCAVTPEDAEEIFQSHLLKGVPVQRLIYHPLRPGANKLE
jgi:(2Fe-2S) ferredoxin